MGLAVGLLVLAVLLSDIAFKKIPVLKGYSDVVNEHDLHPGALYYTDVPVTPGSEAMVREAVKAADQNRMAARAAEKGPN